MKTAIVLVAACLLAVSVPVFAQLAVREGSGGVYVYVADRRLSAQRPMESFTGVNLFRSVGNEPFKPLGRVQAAITREDFIKIAGEGVLADIRREKKLKTDLEAWEYVREHPLLSDYGLIVLNPDFSVAMGAVYRDSEVKKSAVENIRYKAEFITADGKGNNIVEGSIALGTAPAIARPEPGEVIEDDSSLVICWKAKQSTSPDVVFGQIWVRERANTPYKKAGLAFADRDENSGQITFTWRQAVKPGISYGFYLEPQTLLQLPGPLSDTVSLISRDFRGLAQIAIAHVRDTTAGIFISWKTPKDAGFSSGIVIERSKQPSDGFAVIDTLPASSGSYIDTRVLPNVLYHYRFRMLSMRGSLSGPSAYVSHRLFAKKRPVEAPEGVRLTSNEAGYAVVSWKLVASPEVSGYQVFRALQGSGSFEPVSNLLQDSVFTDTSVHNNRLVYKYAVKAMNYDEQSSELSAVVFGRPGKAILPVTPYDVEAYAEPGKVILRWKDMVSYDPYIQGYSVYRKALGSDTKSKDAELSPQVLVADGFRKISPGLFQEVVFADKTSVAGMSYAYAITATDQFGVEGNALGAKKVEVPRITLRAPEIYVRATSKGIAVTWNDVLVPGVDKYLLYARTTGQATPQLVAEVPPGREAFLMADVKAGQRYYCSMQISGKGLKSLPGLEKSALKE